MQPFDKIKAYVDLVCEQIRWKKAHPRCTQEMEDHIIDQRDSYMAQGLDEQTATEKAILETGDAVLIGMQLDRTHRPRPQWTMLATTAVLLLAGIVIRFFVFTQGLGSGEPSDLAFMAIGIAVMLAAYFGDFTLIGKYPKTIYFSVAAMSALLVAAVCIPNAVFFQIRTIAFLYDPYIFLFFPIAFAAVIFTAKNRGIPGLMICGIAFSIFALIALSEPSMYGFFLFVVSGIALLGIAHARNWFGIKKAYGYLLIFAFVILVAAAFILVNSNSYRWGRATVILNPSVDPSGLGYMGMQARLLLSFAKPFGAASLPDTLRQRISNQDSLYQKDLMLTKLTVQFGWIVFAVIVGILLFFMVKGFRLFLKQKSGLGLLVSLSVMMTFTMQVVGFVAFNLGILIGMPFPLPLISGKVATMVNMALIGIMLSVFRTGDIVVDPKTEVSNRKSFTGRTVA